MYIQNTSASIMCHSTLLGVLETFSSFCSSPSQTTPTTRPLTGIKSTAWCDFASRKSLWLPCRITSHTVVLVCVNPPDSVRHLPCHVLALLVHLHLLDVLHVRLSCFSNSCWVQLAVVHVVPVELVVHFWFMALVSTFVNLFHVLLLKVLV